MQASPRPSSAELREAAASVAAGAQPYGLIGLTVGVVLIVIGSAAVCLFVTLLVGGLATLALGLRETLDLVSAWRDAATKGDQHVVEAAGIVLSLAFYAASSGAVLVAARMRGRAGWRRIVGWRPWRPFRGARMFWAIAAGTIVYGFAADAIVERVYPPSKTWITLPDKPVWTALFVVLAVVFAPITEELLFRGWIYTGLRRKIGIWEGINVSAALFALAHWESSQIYALVVFPVGLALGYVRERTGSLAASMAFHAIYNAAASAMMLFGP